MHASLYNIVWSNPIFSPAECDSIISKYPIPETNRAVLIQETVPNTAVRNSAVRFVPISADDQWIFDRLQAVAARVNQDLQFELSGFREGFQIARYSPGEFYHWHADLGADDASLRKLTLVVQLTDPADYEGGAVEFFPTPINVPRERGAVIVFPSYVLHRVVPVTRGVRHSLAAWIAGDRPFR